MITIINSHFLSGVTFNLFKNTEFFHSQILPDKKLKPQEIDANKIYPPIIVWPWSLPKVVVLFPNVKKNKNKKKTGKAKVKNGPGKDLK